MASTDEYMNLDYWKNKWDKGMTGWHIDFVDKYEVMINMKLCIITGLP